VVISIIALLVSILMLALGGMALIRKKRSL